MAVVVMRAETRDLDCLAIAVVATMNFHLFDLQGFIGVLLIVVAYLLRNWINSRAAPELFTAERAGALLIIVSLIFASNLSAFIMRRFWFLISLFGLWRSSVPENIRNLASNGHNESQGNDARGRRQGSRLFDVGLPGSFPKPRRSPKTAADRAVGQISR